MRIVVRAFVFVFSVAVLAACGYHGSTVPQVGAVAPAGQSDAADLTTLDDFQFTADSGPTPAPSPHVFVSTNACCIESFLETDTGDIAPQTDISGNLTGIGQTFGVWASQSGAPYLASPGELLGFSPGDTGNIAPAIKIQGSATLLHTPNDIALDTAGNAYEDDPGCECVEVFAKGATGNVAPIRTISGTNTGINNPQGLALDTKGDLWVATYQSGILEFAKNAIGNVAPIRTIAGSNTMAVFLDGIALDAKNDVLVVASSDTYLVFASNASGNVAPLRVVTRTNAHFHGIDSSISGDIYVANDVTNGAPAEIDVFASTANGPATSKRIIAGASTGVTHPYGLGLQEPIQTVGVRLNGEMSSQDPNYGFILGYFNGTKSTQTHVVVLTAGDPVQFKNLDTIDTHTVAFLGDATAQSAPWPPSFNGGTKASPVGTFIGKTGFTTGALLPGKKSKIYYSGMPGFYMIGCQFHYDSNMMRDVIIVK